MLPTLHRLLSRQLRKTGASETEAPTEAIWHRLLSVLDDHYRANDEHRYTLERSLEISSDEMRALHDVANHERNQLQNIVLALPQAVLVLDAENCIRITNPAAHNLLQHTPEPGGPLDEHLILHYQGQRTTLARIPATAPSGSISVIGWHGRRVAIEVQISPLEGGTLVTITDLTQRLKEEADLQEARVNAEVAQRAEQARAGFLARMSHELRTPLNAIIGYSELLRDDEVTDEQDKDLSRIHGAGSHLLGLINDILDLSKVDAGKMDLLITSISMAPFLDEVAATLAPVAAKQGNHIVVEVSPSLELQTDGVKLRQCLYNLVGNAARYTDKGTIWLRARRDGSHVRFDVEDNGMGIDPQSLTTLFEPFAQATGHRGGTGLGLALVHAMSERMGGSCSVTSTLGEGSTFTIELPFEPPES